MLLNIGCGEWYADGWTNLDLHRNGPKPDVVGSILHLPFSTGTVSRVYLGHVLEHVNLTDLPRALSEVHRVLRPGGEVMVVGPDIALTVLHEPLLIDGVIRGGCRWPGDEHRYTPTGDLTLGFVLAAGFDAHLTDVGSVSEDWPVPGRHPWQFAIYATKE